MEMFDKHESCHLQLEAPGTRRAAFEEKRHYLPQLSHVFQALFQNSSWIVHAENSIER